MRTRFFIIHNPNSGWIARHHFDATLHELQSAGAEFEVVTTARHGQGQKSAADAAASGCFHAVVAAGGDGTVHDVAQGLVGGATPLGIIPMGTGNVFARELGLDFAPDMLAHTLLEGEIREIPVGQVDGQPFLFVVGVGFDAQAVRHFESSRGGLFGRGEFVLPVLRALAAERGHPLVVTTEHGERPAHWVIVTRVKHYAANVTLAEDADLNQQCLHVIRFTGTGPLVRTRQLAALMLGLVRHDPGVEIEAATRILIDGHKTTPVQIDGEAKGYLPLRIGIHPKRLPLIFAARAV